MQPNTITLQITGGDFDKGYNGITFPGKEIINLPPNPGLKSQFKLWTDVYDSMTNFQPQTRDLIFHKDDNNERLEVNYAKKCDKELQIIIEKCSEESKKIIYLFNQWLQSNDFRTIREQINACFEKSGENLLIIQTGEQDLNLWRLPWHTWDLIKTQYKNTEVIFSLHGQTSSNNQKKLLISEKVRVLSVFGNDENLELAEKQTIEEISKKSDVEIRILDQPKYSDLTAVIRSQWDIFYYSGHSVIQHDKISIKINEKDPDPIEDFNLAFENSRIKIAIFNSCDNLDIASVFKKSNISISYLILMSKKVPDKAAAKFFTSFINEYRSGKSFYQSVRIARGILKELERTYPCASWLPVIVQDNSVGSIPNWQNLSRYVSKKRRLAIGLVSSVVMATGIATLRFMGGLQTLELYAFDTMMRSRGLEEKDKHLVIVENIVSKEQDRNKPSLSNESLNNILIKLEKYQPKVIGLDNYLEFIPDKDSNYGQLQSYLENGNLIVPCRTKDGNIEATPAPANVEENSVGFADIIFDGDEQIVRRHFVGAIPNDRSDTDCNTPYSLSYLLAMRYFKDHLDTDIDHISPKQKKLVSLVADKPVNNKIGMYQKLDNLQGSQVLLNYRSDPSRDLPFHKISLKEGDEQLRKLIKDNIVLIGTTYSPYRGEQQDEVKTPYGKMRGVYLQAHMISQLVNAIEEGRPLIWAYPFWSEFFIILGISVLGGVIISMRRDRSNILICLCLGGTVLIIMPALTWISFISMGCLLPLLPTASSLILTGILARFFLSNFPVAKKIQNFSLSSKSN